MGEIINFEARREKRLQRCLSPIIVERIHPKYVKIGFHHDCFTMPFLENGLRGLSHGEKPIWELYKAIDDDYSPYYSYLIKLNTDFGKGTEDVLTTIVDRAVKKSYLGEVRTWGFRVDIKELTKPLRYQLEDGFNIDVRTRRLLEDMDIKNLRELSHLTREELCEVPGMSTEDIARIEKSLAIRGIFLETAEVPLAK